MGSYLSNTKKQQEEMLKEAGYDGFDALFSHIPQEVMMKGELNIPSGCSEMEVMGKMEKMASSNRVFPHIFRGAGAYNHYIPAIVKSVTSKEDFVTAYTPYQAEISQGNLQSIFEFQTMICELTGMDCANASVYDGASAAAESIFMCKERKRVKALVSATAHPQVIETMKTYCYGRDTELVVVPEKDGATDLEALASLADETTACFYLQQPNYYGILEDAAQCGRIVHEKGGKFVMGCNPISLAVLQTPAECGADVAVGEGQPLGLPLAFGGPYLGFMAATKAMMRKLPGRIVGETVDSEGRRGFVLTLQAREQHIRREKAGSNICSNQALCAMTASVYLSAMGAEGLKQAAVSCMSKAHYLQDALAEAGLKPVYERTYFHEFLTESPVDTGVLGDYLESRGYLGGLPVDGNRILWCVTEMNTKAEMDELVRLVKEVCAG
ncbi:aminomethyl-transferring glycine dehydrogenase subunit GcvPA [Clostridium sp. MCC353]|uniref:aminomethyl-transferring glycine dehydrogenase subunit GcvPA n=1 Tax=Clostridium sp. MCC353 TaxID=2592646 RepID=UPI001C02E2C3|nr:aminomethyl-transferring glycine dehydrogenase subunit GcvPA [Clostridium sp. MCC353]MBT9777975.1 aminomethyl-transferring glycine dehydrogenase subunit GcvPA [Clostridium sp. MCC353]